MADESASAQSVRVVALGVVRRDGTDGDQLLVERHVDPASGEPFYRPLGGGVEFGEHSEQALRREFREELGVELAAVSAVGTYEDVFAHDGVTHHEVWRLYEADVVEDWLYERDEFTATEPELDERTECVWKSVAEFSEDGERGATFYPGAALSDL